MIFCQDCLKNLLQNQRWHWSWSIYSKNIVEAHGGSIKGYNNPDGKGATFEFILPIENIQN